MYLFPLSFSIFFTIIPDGGREFPFSFMLTVSSFLDIHPPIVILYDTMQVSQFIRTKLRLRPNYDEKNIYKPDYEKKIELNPN